jgi:hypothetical protein
MTTSVIYFGEMESAALRIRNKQSFSSISLEASDAITEGIEQLACCLW